MKFREINKLRDQNEKGRKGINNELNKPTLKNVKKKKKYIVYIFPHKQTI